MVWISCVQLALLALSLNSRLYSGAFTVQASPRLLLLFSMSPFCSTVPSRYNASRDHERTSTVPTVGTRDASDRPYVAMSSGRLKAVLKTRNSSHSRSSSRSEEGLIMDREEVLKMTSVTSSTDVSSVGISDAPNTTQLDSSNLPPQLLPTTTTLEFQCHQIRPRLFQIS